MTAIVTAPTSPDIPASGLAHVTVKAGHLRVGDYLPFARRIVVAIVPHGTALLISTRCPAGNGPTFTQRWRPATPVIIAPRDL